MPTGRAIRAMADRVRGHKVDLIAAAEARGFLLAAPLALELGAGLVPIRKRGKLPFKTLSHTYDLEYGTDHPGDPRRQHRPGGQGSGGR